jgi:hypothetical protein
MNYEEEYNKLKAAYDALKLMADAQANALRMYEHTLETIKVNTSKFDTLTSYYGDNTCSGYKNLLNEDQPVNCNPPENLPELPSTNSTLKPVPQQKVTNGFSNLFGGTSWGV